jgi:hypothetical protein
MIKNDKEFDRHVALCVFLGFATSRSAICGNQDKLLLALNVNLVGIEAESELLSSSGATCCK